MVGCSKCLWLVVRIKSVFEYVFVVWIRRLLRVCVCVCWKVVGLFDRRYCVWFYFFLLSCYVFGIRLLNVYVVCIWCEVVECVWCVFCERCVDCVY